jgi:flagellar hook-basal body complex protein FliE
MTMVPTIVVSPSTAAKANSRAADADAPVVGPDSFGSAITQALRQAVQTGSTADDQTIKTISGGGSLMEVVTALTHAEMTLRAATVIRDRVVQAYQDMIKAPI